MTTLRTRESRARRAANASAAAAALMRCESCNAPTDDKNGLSIVRSGAGRRARVFCSACSRADRKAYLRKRGSTTRARRAPIEHRSWS